MVLQILNLCALLFYEDFCTFWTLDDFYDCCVFVALVFWIFWHVCIELWYFNAGVWLSKITHAWCIKFGIVSCFQTFYTTVLIKMRYYFYFWKRNFFCLIKLWGTTDWFPTFSVHISWSLFRFSKHPLLECLWSKTDDIWVIQHWLPKF